ncbi:MAG: hypothetical protein LUG16_05715 [Candidatus Gastranaerophilales bacterium]|nr:hypothetical protein [Candidatus Gastranaerophilales bacterium]
MGLAASQARYLGLTARKSNIEYEGQQVNQQRTALAEEVNSLYNKLLAIDVPIAPEVTDYYETNYTFEISNTDDYDGDYVINSYYQNDDGTYYLNTTRTYDKNVATGTVLKNASISTSTDSDGNTVYTLNTTNGSYTLNQAQNSSSMISLINSTAGGSLAEDEQLYYYQDDDGVTHYISSTDMQDLMSGSITSLSSYISDNKSVTESVIFQSANVELDDYGRLSSITGATNPSTGESISFSSDIDTTRQQNTDAYDAALRDYTMSKDEYDKAVADINAQTESLQQEDKVLELRLNQIDTEQNELATELEAVKQILDDNIENTFKTFA